MPIILIGESQVLSALGGVLVLGVAMRLLVGVFLRGTGGSLLAAGLVHAVYNACNNTGALLDGVLHGADHNLAAPIALVLVTTAAAVAIRRRSGRDHVHPAAAHPPVLPGLVGRAPAERGRTDLRTSIGER